MLPTTLHFKHTFHSTDEDTKRALLLDGGRVKGTQVQLQMSSRIEMWKTVEIAGQQDERVSEWFSRRGNDERRGRDRSGDALRRRDVVGGSHRSRSPVANKATGDGDGRRPQTVTVKANTARQEQTSPRQFVELPTICLGTRRDGTVVSLSTQFGYANEQIACTDRRTNDPSSAMTYEWLADGSWFCTRRNTNRR